MSALAVALIIAEVGLRLAGFSYFNSYIADSELGFSLRPNAEGWWKKEGSDYIKINSQGMRDYEHAVAKPKQTIRIAVLGDSFAEAFQVSMKDAFWSVMQQQLPVAIAGSGRKVEVLNFGVSGFSTARELIQLRQRVWQYNPDVVVLLVTLSNDVKDNSRTLTDYSVALPYFVYRNGSLVLDDSLLKARDDSYVFRLQQSFAGKGLDWLRTRSRLLGLFYTVRESYLGQSKPSARANVLPTEPGIAGSIFSTPVYADWEEAWLVTEKLIVQMRDEVQAKGAKFLVVTPSVGIQVSPDSTARAEYIRQLGVTTLFYPDLRIKQLCERENIDVLNLAPSLLDFASRNQTFVHGFGDKKGTGHWNETGHKIAGELIAERLKERL